MLPSGGRRALRAAHKSVRRWRSRLRHHAQRRVGAGTVGRRDIADALRAVGLGEGDDVFFQASMSRVGHIQGGAEAVIEAINDVVGDEALVVMPAYPFQGPTGEYLATDPVFDVRTTPSAMGAVSERFRREHATARSLHPTHSVSARGPGADRLVDGHHLVLDPFGPDTPYSRMVEGGVKQVWFAARHAFTLYHVFEGALGNDFPFAVFLPEPVTVRCLDERGVEHRVETLVHDPEVSRWRVRSRSREKVTAELLRSGAVKAAPLGGSVVEAGEMRDIIAVLERLLEDGVTIYDIEVERGAGGDG